MTEQEIRDWLLMHLEIDRLLVANEAVKDQNKLLEAERDGYRNGQQQAQARSDGLFKSNNLLGGDVRRLTAGMELILAVWKQYQHLDILLSDPAWMLEPGHPMAPQRKCLFDLWASIRKATKEYNVEVSGHRLFGAPL